MYNSRLITNHHRKLIYKGHIIYHHCPKIKAITDEINQKKDRYLKSNQFKFWETCDPFNLSCLYLLIFFKKQNQPKHRQKWRRSNIYICKTSQIQNRIQKVKKWDVRETRCSNVTNSKKMMFLLTSIKPFIAFLLIREPVVLLFSMDRKTSTKSLCSSLSTSTSPSLLFLTCSWITSSINWSKCLATLCALSYKPRYIVP